MAVGGDRMSKSFVEAYKDSINRSVEYFAYEFFIDTGLEFVFEVPEDTISYVDGLYLKDEVQTLYLFSDKKIKTISLVIENNEKVIDTSSMNVKDIHEISLKQITREQVRLKIELFNDRKIILDNNNVFENWKHKASKAIKDIYEKYY